MTASTSTAINICSNALLLLAHPAINSFDEIGAGPALAKGLYPNTFLTFLSMSNWNFCTKTEDLSRDAFPPKRDDFKYQFHLPTDLLRINSTYPVSDYIIEGSMLLANQLDLKLEYQGIIDEVQLPPIAVEALQYLVAMKLAAPLTNDKSKVELYNTLFNQTMKRAVYIDTQNDPNSGIFDAPLVNIGY